jgi:tRNA(Arg) A34 adenosine deaminase TadA
MLSRRKLVAGLGVGLGALMSGIGRALGAGATLKAARHRYAARAAAMRAAGDQAYGAVVVQDGRIVGLGPSRVVTNTDPTGHAEMEAIRDAAKNLGTHDLSGCDMFTTSPPPCRMCETAAYWANIGRVYTGPDAGDLGAPGHGC